MLIKNKIKKILEYNNCTDNFLENLIVSISNDKLNYHDTKINTTLSIKLSKLAFYKELKNIDLNQNMNKVDKHILENLINKFKTLDLSKIVNFFYDFGFYYNSYAEFLYFTNEETEKAVKSFKFDEYEVEIGYPSDLFKLIFSDMGNDKYFEEWGFWNTMKVKNIKEDKFQEAIQIALYLINTNYPGIDARINGYLSPYNFEEIESTGSLKTVTKILYEEPLIFYNKGLELKENEFAYIYFYKVLEYFFLINRKNEYIVLINEYNNSSDKYKINNFIKKISKLPFNSEKENLRKLILNIEEKKLNSIVKKAYKKQLISQETNINLIDELYKRRNSIVHGKDDSLLRITLPSIIYNKQNIDWIEIIKEISTVIIEKFCFEEN